jgi:hypothetical protein
MTLIVEDVAPELLRLILEDITGMVQNHVQNHSNAVLMSGVHE